LGQVASLKKKKEKKKSARGSLFQRASACEVSRSLACACRASTRSMKAQVSHCRGRNVLFVIARMDTHSRVAFPLFASGTPDHFLPPPSPPPPPLQPHAHLSLPPLPLSRSHRSSRPSLASRKCAGTSASATRGGPCPPVNPLAWPTAPSGLLRRPNSLSSASRRRPGRRVEAGAGAGCLSE